MQCFQTQRVFQHGASKYLWREIWDARKANYFAFGETVTDINGAVIMNTDDVTRVRSFGMLSIRSHKRNRFRYFHLFTGANMQYAYSFAVLTRADSHERNPVAVPWIHIRLNLENEASHLVFTGYHVALLAFTNLRCRRIIYKLIQ